jgi:PAS domain S-box-containing protein
VPATAPAPRPPASGNAARLAALFRTGLLETAEAPLHRLARLASQVLGAPIAAISLTDRDGYEIRSSVGLDNAEAAAPLLRACCRQIGVTGEPLLIEDVRLDDALDIRLAAATELVAYAGVPLWTADGHLLGSFCVGDDQPREWTAEQVEILDGLARSVVSEIELRHALQTVVEGDTEIRRRESFYRTVIERSLDMVMTLDRNGVIQYTSSSLRRLLGWTATQTVGRTALEFVHPDDVERITATVNELLQVNGSSNDIQYRFRSADGEWRVLSSSVTNLLRHPVVGAIVVNSRDVTTRHRAEAALHAGESRLHRQNEALVEIAREQARSNDTFEADVRRITGIVAKTLDVARVGVWIYEPDRAGLVCQDLFDRRTGRHLAGEERRVADAPRYFQALQDARTLAVTDASTHPATADLWTRSLRPAGVHATLDAVIRVAGEIAGMVCIQHLDEPRRWTLDEQGFAGSIADMLAVALESSERRVAQELNRRLASIVEGSDDAIFSLSRRGRILSWNPGAERIYGYRADEMIGRPITRLLPADRASEEFQILARLEHGERVDHYETVHIRLDGGLIDVSLTLSPIHDPGGRIVSIAGVARDITARRREQAALVEAKEAAEAASRIKSVFLSSMSHELRTPLNSVIGFANVLRRNRGGAFSDQDLQYLDRILANGKHLLHLIDEVLDLAKIEAGKMELEMGQIDVTALVRETLDTLQGNVRPGVAFLAALPDDVAPVLGDAGKLKQVLINLVGNALKFTADGEVSVSLRVDAATRRPVRLDISDSGIGIPENRLSAIFQSFQQGEDGTARRYGGTGLGLSITASLCELMGYGLTVRSTMGEGSTFSVHFEAEAATPAEPAAQPYVAAV